ncbi:MAG: hypothetical protein ACK4VY_03895 [Brevundimonas sp.]
MSRSIWATLGIPATNDTADIRRAYARRLKAVHPEDDPAGFQALRAAYDQATDMARNGWAVPQPVSPHEAGDEEDDDGAPDADWAAEAADRWSIAPTVAADGGSWEPAPDRWARADAAAPDPDPGRAREAEQAAAHQALCDQLTAIVRDPAGDRQEALTVLIRLFRSPAMDSLQTHGRVEHWLAHLVGYGGPAADELVEPVIQFFGWNTSRIGVDLSHAQPVLRRRDARDLVRRLEWAGDPDHAAWRALTRKPDWPRRLTEPLTPGLAARVAALLDRITWDLPDLQARLNPEAVALWRARLASPGPGPVFLWVLIVSAPLLALIVNGAEILGPADGVKFLVLWLAVAVVFAGLGLAYTFGIARPGQAWIASNPWNRPLWLRLAWAPAALLAPLLGGLLPPAGWTPPALLLGGLGLWAWARITTGHVARPQPVTRDWGRFAGFIPAAAFLLLQLALVGSHGPGLATGLIVAAVILQTGAEAVADERAHEPRYNRRIAAGQMAAVALGLAAVLAAATTGVGLPQAVGLVVAIALADRALAWAREGSLLTARRMVLLTGYIGGFMIAALLPIEDFATQAFVALALWLLTAAGLTALHDLVDGLGLFPRRHKQGRGGKRRPGDLA